MRTMDASTLATFATVSAVSASLGYLIGSNLTSSRPALTHSSNSSQAGEPQGVKSGEDQIGSESDEEEEVDGDLGSIKPDLLEECKLVLVVRTDLGMTKGKIAAQCGHATLACYKALSKSNPDLLKHWERIGQAKIALRCDSEEEMLLLQATAQSLNICARTIHDAGKTQIAAGSQTVLGIGPAPVRLVNQVTGNLKLL